MTPYAGRNTGRLNFEKSNYNNHFSSTRGEIEKAFGIMVQKFQIFKGPIRASLTTINKIIKASVVLHNFFISKSHKELIPKVTIGKGDRYAAHTFTRDEARQAFTVFYKDNIFYNCVECNPPI